MIKISFTIPSVLNAGGGEKKTELEASTLKESFEKISEIMGDDFKRKVLEADGSPRSLINIYINGKNAAFENGLDTSLNENDEVYILPAVAGGSDLSEKELDRFSRQVMLEQIGYDGQLKLKNSKFSKSIDKNFSDDFGFLPIKTSTASYTSIPPTIESIGGCTPCILQVGIASSSKSGNIQW